MSAFPAIHHVAVTVTDLSRSVSWYTGLFGADPVLDEDVLTGGFHQCAYLLDGGQLFKLHTFPQPPDDRFDEHQTGLDHVSFGCPDRQALAAWARRLDDLGIQHSDIEDAHDGSALAFRDPDGIALEFFAPPAPSHADPVRETPAAPPVALAPIWPGRGRPSGIPR